MTFEVPRLLLKLTGYTVIDDLGCHLDAEWFCTSALGVAWTNAIIAGAIAIAEPIHLCCVEFGAASGKWDMSGDSEDMWPGWPGSLVEIDDMPGCPASPCGYNNPATIYGRSHFSRGECGYELQCETGGSDHLLWSVRNWAWGGTNWCYQNGSCECLGAPTYGGADGVTTPTAWKDGSSAFRVLGYFGTQVALCQAIVDSMRGTYTIEDYGCIDGAVITVS